MKNKLPLLLLLLLANSMLFAQRKIKVTEFREIGYSVKATFTPIDNKFTMEGLSVEVNPVSAELLNGKFQRNFVQEGKLEHTFYERSRSSYFLQRVKGYENQTLDYELLLKGLDYLLEENKIDSISYARLLDMVNEDNEAKTQVKLADNWANPYYNNGRYLSAYEVKFINSTTEFKKFKSNVFALDSARVLNKLSTDELKELLIADNSLSLPRQFSLDTYNLPDSIVCPPNSTVVFYFATIPVNIFGSKLSLYFPEYRQEMHWKIENNTKAVNDLYTYYEVDVDTYVYTVRKEDLNRYSLITGAEGIYILGNDILIEAPSLNQNFKLITIAVYDGGFYFTENDLFANDLVDLKSRTRDKVKITLSLEKDVE